MDTKNSLKEKPFFTPFLINLIILLSIGFIAGSIVHVGSTTTNRIYYISFGIIGCFLFVLGNYLQERVINKNKLSGAKSIYFLLVTLLLSIAVAMVSGGLQHFLDFPKYASILIPIGTFLTVLLYLIKNDYKPLLKYTPLLIGTLAFSGILFVITSQIAGNIKVIDHHSHEVVSTKNHDMTSMITNNQSYIENMIPHHIEAINSSYIIQATTQNKDLKELSSNIITNQGREVAQMKEWYKQWFNQEYKDSKNYSPMMNQMLGLSGASLDEEYIDSMILHHSGAVKMAEKASTVSSLKQELTSLSSSIILEQNKEIEKLKTWSRLMKENKGIVNKSPTTKNDTNSTSKEHNDGHSGH